MHHAPRVLREQGYKLTPQRLLIWHILTEGKHYSAAQIHKRVKKDFPGVDLATIYRTLELLVKFSLVQESSFSFGPNRYEATETIGHNHIICRKCGMVEHFNSEKLAEDAVEILDKKGFDANLAKINLSSICKVCLEKEDG